MLIRQAHQPLSSLILAFLFVVVLVHVENIFPGWRGTRQARAVRWSPRATWFAPLRSGKFINADARTRSSKK